MSKTLHDLIPGLREAESRYRDENAEAFAGVEPKICGRVEIAPLTARMFLDLQGADSPLVGRSDRYPEPADVQVMLWRCSPLYKRGDDDLRRFYQATLIELPFEEAVEGLLEYVRRSLAGQPLWKGSIRATPGVGNWAARLVHLFAKEYGWTEDYVLDLPMRRLWQYANRIMEDADATYKEQAPEALRIRQAWLISQNNGGRN
jgi:hypothetical protein